MFPKYDYFSEVALFIENNCIDHFHEIFIELFKLANPLLMCNVATKNNKNSDFAI